MSKLTGKQRAFVSAYLGDCNFNATLAAKVAGYRASSKHSFEAIGSENLTRPGIAEAIDEHFKLAHVSAEEVLVELGQLARGNSKDKIKALALLSQHHGLLDPGKWQDRDKTPLEIRVKYVEPELHKREQEVNDWKDGIVKEIDELNAKGMKIYNAAREKFTDSPDVKAFCELYEKMLGGKTGEPETVDPNMKDPLVVEIIPPERRLQPAAIERMMETFEPEIVEPEPQPDLCRHGNLPGTCNVIEVGYDCPHYYRRNESRYRYA